MRHNYYGIDVQYNRDGMLSEHGYNLLRDYYMLPHEKSPQEAYARAALAWSAGDMELAQRLYDAVSKEWFMFASPVLSNAPCPTGFKVKGLPISCYLSYVPDTVEGLLDHIVETGWLSVLGGGVGGHWSSVRSVSEVAPGPIPFMHVIDSSMLAFRQGKTRQGSYAAYMDISHPDIEEFIELRIPTGDTNRKCLNFNHAINVTDVFMEAVKAGAMWDLVDPNDKSVRKTVKARDLWEKILETRYRTGEPYLNFIDVANAQLNPAQKRLGLTIKGSNLCNEIHLVTSEERTAVCCLSSLNLNTYDEWKDTTLVADLVTMLDNVLEHFIKTAPESMTKAAFSAKKERSIGLGVMGFHSYLQSQRIAFESDKARTVNTQIFSKIYAEARTQTAKLAAERGEPDDIKGTQARNAHLIAIAPNANSSIIANASPSIEPIAANAYTHRTRAGSYLHKNPYLQDLLESLGYNTDKTWSSIISHSGSVQHLDFLSAEAKLVFKTAIELNMEWVIQHAADRQPFVCQGQSVNLFFPANANRAEINKVHIDAWNKGLKGLYYLRTEAASKAEKIGSKIERVPLSTSSECLVCHG